MSDWPGDSGDWRRLGNQKDGSDNAAWMLWTRNISLFNTLFSTVLDANKRQKNAEADAMRTRHPREKKDNHWSNIELSRQHDFFSALVHYLRLALLQPSVLASAIRPCFSSPPPFPLPAGKQVHAAAWAVSARTLVMLRNLLL